MVEKFTKSLLSAVLAGALCLISLGTFGQSSQGAGFAPGKGFRQINFGLELEGYGLPLYVGMDFGVGKMITIGPRLIFQTEGETYYNNGKGVKLRSRHSVFIPSFRGDYHFSGHIEGLPKELDLYGGLTLGVIVSSGWAEYADAYDRIYKSEPDTYTDTRLWIQLGGRYYFSENWGVQLEFATLGSNGNGALGLTYKF